jgi:hypothetical protein
LDQRLKVINISRFLDRIALGIYAGLCHDFRLYPRLGVLLLDR